MNALFTFRQDAPNIWSIVLEKKNLESEKLRNEEDKNALMSNIIFEVKSFRKFQETVEKSKSKLSLMENAIVNSKSYSGFKNTDNGTSRFIENIFKERTSSLERESNSQNAIVKFLTKELLSW